MENEGWRGDENNEVLLYIFPGAKLASSVFYKPRPGSLQITTVIIFLFPITSYLRN